MTAPSTSTETGLDYFGARYFSGAQGRFTSTDPENASASLFNPQAWNAYSYALNNPYKYVDPDGEVPLLVTGAIGAGIGAAGGAGFNLVSQLISNGGDFRQVDYRQVGSAAIGGAVQGGLAGLTLGVGAAAVGIGEAALANGAANVIGGMVTRGTNELLGVPSAPNAPSETTSVAVDFAMGAIGGGSGARQANVRYPLPNVRRELAIIANSNRRSLRPAKVEAFTQYANQQQIRNTVSGSVIGTSVMGFFTDLFFRAGNVFNPPPVQARPREQVTSKICYTDESGKQVCQ
jgi:RHS repeat-associated protein